MRTEDSSTHQVDQSAANPAADIEDGAAYPLPERPALHLDVEHYAAMLDAPDLTDEERRAFVEALWGIVVGFVDLGFQIHPVQQAPSACGQVGPTTEDLAKVFASVVSSPATTSETRKRKTRSGPSLTEGKPEKEDS